MNRHAYEHDKINKEKMRARLKREKRERYDPNKTGS